MINQSTVNLITFQLKKYTKYISGFLLFFAVLYCIFQAYFLMTKHETILRAEQSKIQAQRMREELNRRIYSNQKVMSEDEKQIANMYAYIMCNMSGELCKPNQAEKINEGTISSKISSLISLTMSNPPSSGLYWAKNSLEGASLIPKTYAQGIGFVSLTSFQTIWKAMRDITFLILVIIIVASGFIIMFNIPLGGKSSVTIEAVLPRLVITLLLISFSYAIAGFLIDAMYVSMFLVISLFAPIIQGSQSDIIGSALSGQPTNLFYAIWWAPLANGDIWDISRSLTELVPPMVRYVVDSTVYYSLGHILLLIATAGLPDGSAVSGPLRSGAAKVGKGLVSTTSGAMWKILSKISSIKDSLKNVGIASNDTGLEAQGSLVFVSGTAKGGLGLVALILQLLLVEPFMAVFRSYFTLALVFVLLMISLLFTFFKVFAMLFGTYVDIILSIMFAPIYIVMNAMPGSKAFEDWIKNLAINLLTFPIVMALLMVVSYMTQFADTTEMWTPPFLTGIASQRAIQVLVAGTILFNIPSFIEKIREVFGYKKGFSMSPLSMVSPWLALTGSVVGMATGANQMNTLFRKSGGATGAVMSSAGVAPKTTQAGG